MLTFLGIIAGIIAVLLIVAAVTPKGYSLQRIIVINKPVDEVFDYIRFLKNQDYYNKWVMTDPHMKKIYTGTDGTPGFIYAWDSEMKNAGKGEQEILSITPNRELKYEVRFIKPFAGIAPSYINTEALPDGTTQITWSFSSKMPYPMNLVMLFMNMENMLGKDMTTSLNNLKENLER